MGRVGIGVAALCLIVGCKKDSDTDQQTVSVDTSDTGTTIIDDREPFEWTRPASCDSLPEPPYDFTRISGFTGAEDFAFDIDGNYVATDGGGNIVRIDYEGNQEVWVPGFGEAAGTAFMLDGTLAIANVETGRVMQVQENGGTNRIMGGLSYPNGVTVDMWGRVYVADQNLGFVKRWDPVWDTTEVVAEGLYNPNGLALSPDQNTLYVGSFGGGTIHSVDLQAELPNTTLFAETPSVTLTGSGTDEACQGRNQADECFLTSGLGIGTCEENGKGGLFCDDTVDVAACTGKVFGDYCSTTALGEVVDSLCTERTTTGELFCPKVPGPVVTACVDRAENDPCTAMGIDRSCRWSWEDILVCDITPWDDVAAEACVGLSTGDYCVVEDYEGFSEGSCQDSWGSDLTCEPDWWGSYSFEGGLDGVSADACGNIWVTEYTLGYVWRFSPDGTQADLAVDTETFWIPNLHWGSGVGGWDKDALYIQDRLDDTMFEVRPGVEGGPVPYSVEYAQ